MVSYQDVIVVGAGPAGLTVATELALAGVRVVVVEALAVRSAQSKAMNLQPRTAELFELRGLLSSADDQAIGRIDGGHFAGIPLDYGALDTRFPYQIGILQARVEEILEARLTALGGEVRRNWRLTGFEQDDEGVTVHGPQTLRAGYLVGCDGGRSTVRKLAGVGFPGTEATQWSTVADVVLGAGTAAPPTGWTSMGEARRRRPDGTFASVVPIGEPGLYRFVFSGDEEDVASRFRLFYGDEYELVEVRYASRFSNAARQADRYRVGRVFLAGDAAHVHLPIGGQGLNTGVQDAFNLGWKLAAVLAGDASDDLLDTYETERHPAGARVLANVLAQSAVRGPDPGTKALHDILATLLALPEANRAAAAMISGLDVDYGGPGGAPVGTRLPDFRVGEGWASELFHAGTSVRLTGTLPWADVQAVTVRPDGYISSISPPDPPGTPR